MALWFTETERLRYLPDSQTSEGVTKRIRKCKTLFKYRYECHIYIRWVLNGDHLKTHHTPVTAYVIPIISITYISMLDTWALLDRNIVPVHHRL